MKKYFYTDGTDKFGPFSLEELKEKEITRDTKIWFQELGDWKKASTIPELNELFTLIPPPINHENINPHVFIKRESKFNTIDIFVFLSIFYWFALNLSFLIIKKFVENYYEKLPFKYYEFFTSIIWSLLPIVFSLSIKNKTLRLISLILSICLAISMLYNNIDWFITALK